MVKLIFSDFDETMLNYYSEKNFFDEYQLDVLKRLKEREIMFCIVTGRCVSFFRQFQEILPYVSYILASNGSCIYDVNNDQYIYQRYIGEQEVSFLLDYVKRHHFEMVYNSNGEQKGEDDNVNLQSCEQVILSFQHEYLENVLEDLKNISYVNYNNICKHGSRYTIDVNDYRVSKGNAISFLCKYLDIHLDDTIGFGDSDNDVSMFSVVGKSISVNNGTDRIRSLANHITLSSMESGVFKYIDKHILS